MEIVCRKSFRASRLRRAWTMRDLSAASGVAVNAICSAEHGRPVRPKTARRLCAALGAEFDELFEVKEV